MAPKKVSGYIRSFAVVAAPTEQQVTVMVNGQMHVFQFTDERLPPAAPVQMSQFNASEKGTNPSAAGGPFGGLPAIRGGGHRIRLPAAPKRPLPEPKP